MHESFCFLFQAEFLMFLLLGLSIYHLCVKGHDYLISLIIFEVNLVVVNMGFVFVSYFLGDFQGQILSLCYFTVAAGETALILSCLFVIRPFFSTSP